MQFITGYHTSAADRYSSPMDRSFYNAVENPDAGGTQGTYQPSQGFTTNPTGKQQSAVAMDNEFGLGVGDVGMSVPMGIAAPNVQGIYSKIRSGIGKIEIGFPVPGSGNRNMQTPGMYGKDQRQAIRELGLANDVEFTTHAAYNVMGMTGVQEQAGQIYAFDMNQARLSQQEIERAIDFAADVPGGGSVVVHTGEYSRPLTDMWLPDTGEDLSRGKDGRMMWKQRLTEDKDAKLYLIDERSGRVVQQIEKSKLVAYPRWRRAKEGYAGIDQDGNQVHIKPGQYIDYQDRLIRDPYDPIKGRVPQYDEHNRQFVIDRLNFEDFKSFAHEYNQYREQKMGRPLKWQEKLTPAEAFLRATLETQEGTARGWSGYYGDGMQENINRVKALNEAREFYLKLDKDMPEEEKWKLMQDVPLFRDPLMNQYIPSERKSPLEIIEEAITNAEAQMRYAQEASSSQLQQAMEIAETKEHIVEPIKYVDKYAIRHYAEAALHAMERSGDPNNPIVLNLEHIFPERFGGHPAEHMWIVKQARDRMAEMLTNKEITLGTASDKFPTQVKDERGNLIEADQPNPWYRPGVSEEEARTIAEKHIKITIDTAHLNLWRKHFQPRPGAKPEDNEKEFQEWYLGYIEEMAKNGMVGNLHLVDNYGYQDEHLAPGQGNAPIKQTLAILKKYGYDKAITVEPGADATTDNSDVHGVLKAWRFLGAGIYGTGGGGGAGGGSWSGVQNAYFGMGQSPYFIFGAYSPSNDWTLWSQAPLE